MSTSTDGNSLGVVISNATARKIIYGSYIVLIVIAGAIQVGFAAVQSGQPGWLTVGVAVLGYLGVPVGGLALVNTGTAVAPASKS